MDTKGIGKNNLQKYCAVLARDFPFGGELFQFYKFRTSHERSRRRWQSSPRRTANHRDQEVSALNQFRRTSPTLERS